MTVLSWDTDPGLGSLMKNTKRDLTINAVISINSCKRNMIHYINYQILIKTPLIGAKKTQLLQLKIKDNTATVMRLVLLQPPKTRYLDYKTNWLLYPNNKSLIVAVFTIQRVGIWNKYSMILMLIVLLLLMNNHILMLVLMINAKPAKELLIVYNINLFNPIICILFPRSRKEYWRPRLMRLLQSFNIIHLGL